MTDPLTDKLRAFVQQENIQPDPNFATYANGNYCVLDCVFSPRANWEFTVKPMVERFAAYGWEKDIRTFSDFVADVDSFGEGKFERYAAEVLINLGVLSGRRKAEVAYDVAKFLIQNDIEYVADFHRLSTYEVEELVGFRLVESVRGMGSVLASYLILLFGREDYIKVDTLLNRLMGHIGDWKFRYGNPQDILAIRKAIITVAEEMKITPSRLDNALWKYESIGRKPLPWIKEEKEA
ncbi:hypothetical protein [Deinococcus budaensis]|uniref:Uncharacterized protein n=1 Tax=Deinococcus budaensis TaxID=1665626 RepID=A0A7W8LQW2_9DEIO|nr:hypothetical protein [Deinococcus budaensis]MBB5235010.1 hypothetical protein [Deinococcus budaensis]